MHKGGCRDECIALAALVWDVQPGTTLCYGGINGQCASVKFRQYLLL
jgi:hypothetical protein